MTKYQSNKIRKNIPSLVMPVNFNTIANKIGDIDNIEEIDIVSTNEMGRRIGLFVPGRALVKIKGNSQELLSFTEFMSVNYSEPLDKWTVRLYACYKEHNSIIKDFIINIAIPIIKDWLIIDKVDTWYLGRRYLQIGINEDISKYCVFETHNDKIIHKFIHNYFNNKKSPNITV
ncbi:MAG: hypothetical protein LBT43_13115 [Prevotella sp.]|jgi:hypothetical protein|nr:hypothetical protein [Prevotella sp.]